MSHNGHFSYTPITQTLSMRQASNLLFSTQLEVCGNICTWKGGNWHVERLGHKQRYKRSSLVLHNHNNAPNLSTRWSIGNFFQLSWLIVSMFTEIFLVLKLIAYMSLMLKLGQEIIYCIPQTPKINQIIFPLHYFPYLYYDSHIISKNPFQSYSPYPSTTQGRWWNW